MNWCQLINSWCHFINFWCHFINFWGHVLNWCHFINFWGQVLNWCQLIKFWGHVLNWCQLINIWGHVLLITWQNLTDKSNTFLAAFDCSRANCEDKTGSSPSLRFGQCKVSDFLPMLLYLWGGASVWFPTGQEKDGVACWWIMVGLRARARCG